MNELENKSDVTEKREGTARIVLKSGDVKTYPNYDCALTDNRRLTGLRVVEVVRDGRWVTMMTSR